MTNDSTKVPFVYRLSFYFRIRLTGILEMNRLQVVKGVFISIPIFVITQIFNLIIFEVVELTLQIIKDFSLIFTEYFCSFFSTTIYFWDVVSLHSEGHPY